MMLENPKNIQKKFLELINNYSKVADTGLIQKNQLFSYKLAMKKYLKLKMQCNSIIIPQIKYLYINLTKYICLFKENYKTD